MKIKNILQEHSGTIAIILAIIVTAILSFTDLIQDEDVLSYLLCAVAGLSINVFIALLSNEKNISEIAKRLEPVSSCVKVTRKEHYRLLTEAVLNAKSNVWIMTIDRTLKSTTISTIPEREIYYKTVETIARKHREITVRRVYGLPINEAARNDKIAWIRADIEKIRDCPNYYVRIFDWKKFSTIPAPLSMQMVDNSFVGLVNLQRSNAGVEGGGEDLCIRDPDIVGHLKLYYEEIWEKCEEFKTGNEINWDCLQ